MTRPLPSGDDGNAVVEFLGVAVVLMLPIAYLLLTVFAVQRAAFAVDEGAREAGRAITLAGTTPAGLAQARAAATLALTDQGITTRPTLRYTLGGCTAEVRSVVPVLTPGAHYTVCLSVPVALPFTGDGVLRHLAPSAVTVRGEYVLVVNPYEQSP